MTQRPIRLSRKATETGLLIEELVNTNQFRRPTLCSNNEIEREILNSVRYRDFASCFQSSNTETEPYFVTTSHSAPPFADLAHETDLPIYPMVQFSRWNSQVDSSSNEDCLRNLQTNKQDCTQPTHKCKCKQCTSERCPSKVSSTSTLKSMSTNIRANIMTFCDRNTMTPRLANVGCGNSIVRSTRVSEVSVTPFDIAGRDDNNDSMLYNQYTNPRRSPTPILKKTVVESYDCDDLDRVSHCGDEYDSAETPQRVAEKDYDYRKLATDSYLIPYANYWKDKAKFKRRMLYNEGISDLIADRYPLSPIASTCPVNSKKKSSKSSVKTPVYSDEEHNYIPYGHRSNSKYHQSCKKSQSKMMFYESDEMSPLVAVPKVVKMACNRPNNYYSYGVPFTSIKLPKKVLSSERDIDDFIDYQYEKQLSDVPSAHMR